MKCTYVTCLEANCFQNVLTQGMRQEFGSVGAVCSIQHDTNATIFNCNITNCSFKTLLSDKYIEHAKKYHPTEEQNATENQINHHQTILNTTPIMVKTPVLYTVGF